MVERVEGVLSFPSSWGVESESGSNGSVKAARGRDSAGLNGGKERLSSTTSAIDFMVSCCSAGGDGGREQVAGQECARSSGRVCMDIVPPS